MIVLPMNTRTFSDAKALRTDLRNSVEERKLGGLLPGPLRIGVGGVGPFPRV